MNDAEHHNDKPEHDRTCANITRLPRIDNAARKIRLNEHHRRNDNVLIGSVVERVRLTEKSEIGNQRIKKADSNGSFDVGQRDVDDLFPTSAAVHFARLVEGLGNVAKRPRKDDEVGTRLPPNACDIDNNPAQRIPLPRRTRKPMDFGAQPSIDEPRAVSLKHISEDDARDRDRNHARKIDDGAEDLISRRMHIDKVREHERDDNETGNDHGVERKHRRKGLPKGLRYGQIKIKKINEVPKAVKGVFLGRIGIVAHERKRDPHDDGNNGKQQKNYNIRADESKGEKVLPPLASFQFCPFEFRILIHIVSHIFAKSISSLSFFSLVLIRFSSSDASF